MKVSFRMFGENVKEKLTPFETEYQLYFISEKKDEVRYDVDLTSYHQYLNLEKLVDSLKIEIFVRSNAEWLAVLAYNSNFGKSDHFI